MSDFAQILAGSVMPPELRAMLPAQAQPRTPQESLDALAKVITSLAQRGTDAANGLTVTSSRDPRGITIRIDLPEGS